MERVNELEIYLKKESETLNLCDIVFIENNKLFLNFFKDAIPLLSMVEICLDLEDYFGYEHIRKEMTMKYLRGSVVDYIKDIIELLNSNDPKILGKYYNDIETLTGLEDGLTKILSSNDHLDLYAEILLVEARRIFSKKKKNKDYNF